MQQYKYASNDACKSTGYYFYLTKGQADAAISAQVCAILGGGRYDTLRNLFPLLTLNCILLSMYLKQFMFLSVAYKE